MVLPWRWSKQQRLKWISGGSLALIGVCIFFIAYPELPAAQFSIQQEAKLHAPLQKLLPEILKAPDVTPPETGNWLIIPSINVKEQIWEGSSLSVLTSHEGVWHQAGNPTHNLVLAGHRFQYLPPNTHTFYSLVKLHAGDAITLVWGGIQNRYRVIGTEVVTPDHVEILDASPTPKLTLYTCSDWQTTHRLVVLAAPAT